MGAYSNRVIADGASYYWRLGESSGLTAVASVGGANGTISGGVTLGQAGAIADGTTAMAFDGATGQILTASLSVPLAFTVEAWMKVTTSSLRALWSMRSLGGTGTTVLVGVNNSAVVYNSLGPGVGGNRAVNDGLWHHVVYILTGSAVSFYVDGVADTLSVTLASTASVGPATIGRDTNSGYFPGTLDDIAIYPRALTAAEVSAHYALGRTTEVSALGVYAERVISDGASNYWRLNEASGTTAVDIVSAKNGTISGGVTLGQPSPLSDGTSAMLFNGTTGKIDTTPVAILTPCTIETWVKTTGTATYPYFSTPYSGPQEEWKLQLSAGAPAALLYAAGQAQTTICNGTGNYRDGLWHQIVWVFQSNAWAVYVDGVLNGSGTPTFPLVGMTLPVTLGNKDTEYWPGSLDEVAIYPRALSASEVAAHYALSTVPVPRDLNTGLYTYLLGVFGLSSATSYAEQVRADGATNHWRLGETSGTVAVDAIGGANGTISGGVTLNQPSAMADGDKAMSFNGVAGAKIQSAAAVTLPVAATIEGWINAPFPSGTGGNQRPWLTLRPEANFQLAVNADTLQCWTGTFSAGVRTVNDGQWHHVAIVLTGTRCLMYVDGVLDSDTANVHALQTAPVRLGYDQADNMSFTGSLDDVSIYPRALTATEIAAHSSLGRSGLSGGNDLTTLITRYLATLTGDMTARWKQMEKNAGF